MLFSYVLLCSFLPVPPVTYIYLKIADNAILLCSLMFFFARTACHIHIFKNSRGCYSLMFSYVLFCPYRLSHTYISSFETLRRSA
ncbi:hypothetical protein T492DRAFT_930217 [Pavlovales sp. CCMP2436]|nr:hypothetical protein T492DRAFT_930217 [Pavlovales sp. CCMP2436]